MTMKRCPYPTRHMDPATLPAFESDQPEAYAHELTCPRCGGAIKLVTLTQARYADMPDPSDVA